MHTFDFQNLTVYKNAKSFHSSALQHLVAYPGIGRVIGCQLERAALSIPLNIAEGSGRYTNPDRRNFFIIARSSVFECVAIFDILNDQNQMTPEEFLKFTSLADELSRMLYRMIDNLKKK